MNPKDNDYNDEEEDQHEPFRTCYMCEKYLPLRKFSPHGTGFRHDCKKCLRKAREASQKDSELEAEVEAEQVKQETQHVKVETDQVKVVESRRVCDVCKQTKLFDRDDAINTCKDCVHHGLSIQEKIIYGYVISCLTCSNESFVHSLEEYLQFVKTGNQCNWTCSCPGKGQIVFKLKRKAEVIFKPKSMGCLEIENGDTVMEDIDSEIVGKKRKLH